MNENRLFVGNLPYQAMESDVEEHFSQAGVVSDVKVVTDRETGRSRGFAFVEFSDAECAKKAVDMFHQQDFLGRKLVVNVARPRQPREGGEGRRY
mgnify:CR=1 FL=1